MKYIKLFESKNNIIHVKNGFVSSSSNGKTIFEYELNDNDVQVDLMNFDNRKNIMSSISKFEKLDFNVHYNSIGFYIKNTEVRGIIYEMKDDYYLISIEDSSIEEEEFYIVDQFDNLIKIMNYINEYNPSSIFKFLNEKI